MTSKSLYFNLMREDMKRRIWTFFISTLAFIVGLPLYTMLRLDRMKNVIESGDLVEAQTYFAKLSSTQNNGTLNKITILVALMCAINGFFYLYSKSKVDSYHSMPVKREKLFLVFYLDGIIIYVIPYIINLMLYFVIGIANGLVTSQALKGAFVAFLINLVGYLLVYSIAILAVILTGNLIVGVLGIGIFLVYGPAVVTLVTGLCSSFLETYYANTDISKSAGYLSPVFAYFRLNTLYNTGSYLLFLIGTLLTIIVATIACLLLHRIRPSEAAGKAMAFPKTQAVIKILIVIPSALLAGMLFMSMSETKVFSWMIFGVIFIGFIVHGIIEIIYNSDFRSIIANKLQLCLSILLALGIAGGFKADIIGYDKYLPQQDKVESTAISFDYLEPFNDYYDINNEYKRDRFYGKYAYISYADYRLDHMKLTNWQGVSKLVEYAIDNNVNGIGYDERDEAQTYVSFSVRYNLKNGSEKYRYYTVKFDDITDYIEDIYKEKAYKEGVYQIFNIDKEVINSVNYFNSMDGTDEQLKMTKEQLSELVDIYRSELRNLTANEMLEGIPVTLLNFMIGDVNDFVFQEYYVYPSFTKTIEFMKSLGANLESSVNPDNINSITIRKYVENEEYDIMKEKYGFVKDKGLDTVETVFTDKEDIAKIADALIIDRFTRGMKVNGMIDYNMEVYIEFKYTSTNTTAAYLLKDKLPEEIRKRIE